MTTLQFHHTIRREIRRNISIRWKTHTKWAMRYEPRNQGITPQTNHSSSPTRLHPQLQTQPAVDRLDAPCSWHSCRRLHPAAAARSPRDPFQRPKSAPSLRTVRERACKFITAAHCITRATSQTNPHLRRMRKHEVI